MRLAVVPRRVAAVVTAMCLVFTAATGARPEVGARGRAGTNSTMFPTPEATAFLDTFVRPDGRVSRPDQGGDTVSEGQAYGMLLALTAGDDRLFGRIWQWTRDHLQRDDGLFAWRAGANGRIWDPAPASDADVLIAWALLLYRGSGAAALHRAGRRVADAVLAHEVIAGPGGMPVLTAGPWATGRPATLNPSYWSIPTFTDLAGLTGNREWERVADSAVLLTERLTQGGRLLPPDWAELTAAGELLPRAALNNAQAEPRYGLDAQRTVAWFAASCDPRARVLASSWWPLLRRPARSRALALALDGTVLDPTRAVLPLVAAAAAADAAGAGAESRRLLREAELQQREQPGYYGAAWNAFGPVLLNSRVLSGC